MGKIAKVQEVTLSNLKPYEKNAKIHGTGQIEKLKASIEEFGFLTPCLIDENYNIIAGHGRVMAAKDLGMETVPCVFIEGLTEAQRKAYILADNRLGELGEWDMELVNSELMELQDMDFDIELTGFEIQGEDEFMDIDQDGLGDAKGLEHCMSIDKRKYMITDEEYDMLNDAIDSYVQDHGVFFGFIREKLTND